MESIMVMVMLYSIRILSSGDGRQEGRSAGKGARRGGRGGGMPILARECSFHELKSLWYVVRKRIRIIAECEVADRFHVFECC